MVAEVKAKLLIVAGVFALVAVLYALSVGPAFRVCLTHRTKAHHELNDGKGSPEVVLRADERVRALTLVYGPLDWACNQSEASAALFKWYVMLWVNEESGF